MSRLLLPILLVMLLLTGCGANGGSASTSKASTPRAPAQEGSMGVVGTGAKDFGSFAASASKVKAGGATVATPVVPRSVIRTASIVVTVKDAAAAADRATALAKAAGGMVQDDTRNRQGGGSAHLVLRVPPADVPSTLTVLSRLGKEQRRQADDRDVTDQAIDLSSRITTQQASVNRVRALLARASSLPEITSIEGELTRREADLESLQNRSQALVGQVDLATVDVSLSSTAPPVVGGVLGFSDGLAGGRHAVTVIAMAVAVTVGALLPFSPLLLLAFGGRLLGLRRRGGAAGWRGSATPTSE